jgi:hypothetical protein
MFKSAKRNLIWLLTSFVLASACGGGKELPVYVAEAPRPLPKPLYQLEGEKAMAVDELLPETQPETIPQVQEEPPVPLPGPSPQNQAKVQTAAPAPPSPSAQLPNQQTRSFQGCPQALLNELINNRNGIERNLEILANLTEGTTDYENAQAELARKRQALRDRITSLKSQGFTCEWPTVP